MSTSRSGGWHSFPALVLAVLVGCGSSAGSGSPDTQSPDAAGAGADGSSPMPGSSEAGPDGGVADGGRGGAEAGSGATLSAMYPGDVGIGNDPRVVWWEGFDEGSLSAFAARYDQVDNQAGMALLADIPPKSIGTKSLSLTTSGSGANATDFYKSFSAGYDEWFVRWYAKYQTGSVTWHHTGVWFGGYDPALRWPDPQAGLKPSGNDRISYAIEPVFGTPGAMRFDTYDYWMNMHSWMAMPSGSTAYYGNAVVNQNAFLVDEGTWVCLEMHVKLNTDPSSDKGSVLEIWKNDAPVVSYTDSGPDGYWIRDKFCTPAADGTECTAYPAAFNTVLDLQARTTTSLKLNYFWPQNYITTAGVTGTVQFGDMVVATTRVGCIQ
ncbi:MAG TPA: hypothetical protein VF765_23595 [Polyangiaceae bacterium]